MYLINILQSTAIECFNSKGICGGYFIPVSGPYLGFGIFFLAIFSACFILVLIKTCYPKFKQVCFNHGNNTTNYGKTNYSNTNYKGKSNQGGKDKNPRLMSEEQLISGETNQENTNEGNTNQKNSNQQKNTNYKNTNYKNTNYSSSKKIGIPKKVGSYKRVNRNYYHRSSCDYSHNRRDDHRTKEWLINHGQSINDRRRCNSLNPNGSLVSTNVSFVSIKSLRDEISKEEIPKTEIPKEGVPNGKIPNEKIPNEKILKNEVEKTGNQNFETEKDEGEKVERSEQQKNFFVIEIETQDEGMYQDEKKMYQKDDRMYQKDYGMYQKDGADQKKETDQTEETEAKNMDQKKEDIDPK